MYVSKPATNGQEKKKMTKAREEEIQAWEERMAKDCRESEAHEALLDAMAGEEDPMSLAALRRRWPNATDEQLAGLR